MFKRKILKVAGEGAISSGSELVGLDLERDKQRANILKEQPEHNPRRGQVDKF